jgi:hypothetical protein
VTDHGPVPVAIDADDSAGPPRQNGELVFEAPWQGRAFGLCMALLEREGLGWDAFRPFLIAQLDDEPERAYYDSFALALERFAQARLPQ